MFKDMKKRIKNEKGLTLIELLAVIVILAIIAAIAIPAIGNIIQNSRERAAKADVANIMNAAAIYFTENPADTTFSNTDTNAGDYISDPGTVATYTVTLVPGGNTVVATGTLAGGQAYAVTAGTTLNTLQVGQPNIPGDGFTIGGND